MRKFVLAIISTIILSILTGCGTKRLVEAHILRDSVYFYRDSVVLRYVKDSVTEREKTTISTRRNELTGQDTVFVVREVWRDRWRMRADTIRKVEWRDRWRTKIDTREVTRMYNGWRYMALFFLILLCGCCVYVVVSRIIR